MDTRTMTIRLPGELHDKLRQVSYTTRRSMNDLIMEALRRDLAIDRELLMAANEDDGWPADDAIGERWGYCGQCGQLFPAWKAPRIHGTRQQAYDALLPAFTAHTCSTEEIAR